MGYTNEGERMNSGAKSNHRTKAITMRGGYMIIEKESLDKVIKCLSVEDAKAYMEIFAAIPRQTLYQFDEDDGRDRIGLKIKDTPQYLLEKIQEIMNGEVSAGLSRKITFEILGRTGTDLWDTEITSIAKLNEIMTAMPETYMLVKYQGRIYRGLLEYRHHKKDTYWNTPESFSFYVTGSSNNIDFTLYYTQIIKESLVEGWHKTLRDWVNNSKKISFIDDDKKFEFDSESYDQSVKDAVSDKLENQVLEYNGIAIKKRDDDGYGWGPKYQDCFNDGRVVVEPRLELSDSDYKNKKKKVHEDIMDELPLIRVFSLKLRRYIFVDIRYTQDVKWDEQALGKLVLPKDMKGMLHKVFQSKANERATDLIQGKGGGMVILANGSPGVGKTMTAEIFAEYTKRPLYTMEVGDLGTSTQQVEQSLYNIFARVTKWNAVLLFDECDIFMYKRGNDLQRAGIVGIFLRLLDYYQGFLFLTSNRSDVIDEAFKSRITLSLDYPSHTPESREEIWQLLLEANGIELSNGDSLQRVSERDLNGRQIRNAVLLIKTVHGNKVTADQVRELTRYIGVNNAV